MLCSCCYDNILCDSPCIHAYIPIHVSSGADWHRDLLQKQFYLAHAVLGHPWVPHPELLQDIAPCCMAKAAHWAIPTHSCSNCPVRQAVIGSWGLSQNRAGKWLSPKLIKDPFPEGHHWQGAGRCGHQPGPSFSLRLASRRSERTNTLQWLTAGICPQKVYSVVSPDLTLVKVTKKEQEPGQ